jgi:hypothetical protein
VVFFTSFPAYNLVGTQQNKKGMKIRYVLVLLLLFLVGLH